MYGKTSTQHADHQQNIASINMHLMLYDQFYDILHA